MNEINSVKDNCFERVLKTFRGTLSISENNDLKIFITRAIDYLTIRKGSFPRQTDILGLDCTAECIAVKLVKQLKAIDFIPTVVDVTVLAADNHSNYGHVGMVIITKR